MFRRKTSIQAGLRLSPLFSVVGSGFWGPFGPAEYISDLLCTDTGDSALEVNLDDYR